MHLNLHRITSKIVTLGKCGRITCARKLFDEMPHRDAVAWNAMLSSYSQLGNHREALSLFHRMRISNTKPDHFSFTATLSACAGLNNLQNGAKIHALVIIFGYRCSLPVNNSLIDMYGKCLEPCSANKVFQETNEKNEVTWCSLLFAYTNTGQFNMAKEVFHTMPKRVTISWNIMIVGHAKYGEIELCLSLFREMRETSCAPDQWTLSALMNACGELSEMSCGYMVHAFVIKTGWSAAVEAKNSIISFYAKLGSQSNAIKEFESIGMLSQVSWNAIIDAYMKTGDTHEAFNVFKRAPEKNVVSWTSMITGYARNGDGEQALSFFVDMMRNCLCPDDFTFGAVLHACSSLAVLGHGRMVHGCVIYYGFHAHVYVGNGLVNMYAKCGDIEGSSLACSEILDKDLVSWNAMLFGFGMHGLASQALQLYDHMVASGTKPDKATFISLLITCSHSGLVEKGREIFESMRSIYGLPCEMEHVSCMVDMLGRAGYLTEAKELANKHSEAGSANNTSSREALLGACTVHGNIELGTHLGEDLKILEPQKEMSFVLLSNLYCASGKWKEAEMVRKAMADQGVKKMPGCSWIEVRNEVTAFVAGTPLVCPPGIFDSGTDQGPCPC
ncbi:hypothetical protein Q3G72_003570 [Acer saccharum]|nr:hypothetical protein Q3G72_003570 [Acer saccharum]